MTGTHGVGDADVRRAGRGPAGRVWGLDVIHCRKAIKGPKLPVVGPSFQKILRLESGLIIRGDSGGQRPGQTYDIHSGQQ